MLDDAWTQVSADPAIDPYDPTAISAGANLAIYLGLVGEALAAAIAAQDSLQRAQALGGPSTLSLAHFAVGYAYLDADPTHAVVELRGSVAVQRSRRVEHRARSLDARARARLPGVTATRVPLRVTSLGRSASPSRWATTPPCASMLDLAIPILADGERWHAVLAVDNALTDGTLPAPAFNNDGVAEARSHAVTASRATLAVSSRRTATTRAVTATRSCGTRSPNSKNSQKSEPRQPPPLARPHNGPGTGPLNLPQ